MLIDYNKTISVTDANHNFSKLLKKVDEMKEIIIMKRKLGEKFDLEIDLQNINRK